jgi:hypothetical protein
MILKAFIFLRLRRLCNRARRAVACRPLIAPAWPLKINIFVLGVANGAFAVAAIGTMMMLASGGDGASEGIRMGVWGAAQAVSFGLGGFLGTVAIDVTRALDRPIRRFPSRLFSALEAGLFLAAAAIALLIKTPASSVNGRRQPGPMNSGSWVSPPHLQFQRSEEPCSQTNMMCHATTAPNHYDVIVIGGGPAGARAAERLAFGRAQHAAGGQGRTHQALWRRHPVKRHGAVRDRARTNKGASPRRADDWPERAAGRYGDRRCRPCRHGRSRPVRSLSARACPAQAGADYRAASFTSLAHRADGRVDVTAWQEQGSRRSETGFGQGRDWRRRRQFGRPPIDIRAQGSPALCVRLS